MPAIDDAWTLLHDLPALRARYAAEADPAYAVALARAEAPTPETAIAITEEATGPIMEPLLLATILAQDQAQKRGQILSVFRSANSPRSIPTLKAIVAHADTTRNAIAAKGKDPWGARWWQNVADYGAAFLARGGEPAEAIARAPSSPGLLAPLIAVHAGIPQALAALQVTDADGEGPLRFMQQLCEAFADAKIKEAVPGLLALVRTGIGPHALAALGAIGDSRALEVARAIHRETHGDRLEVALFRLAAESVLVHDGGAWSIEIARDALDIRQPRYGSPKAPELQLLRRLAAEALLTTGDPRDRARVARLVRISDKRLRDLARRAGAPEKVIVYDAARVTWIAAQSNGVATLISALDAPDTLLRGEIAKHLLEHGDEAAKLALARWARARLEEEPGPFVDSEHEADPDLAAALRAAKKLVKHGATRAIFADASHPWITTGVLETTPQVSPRIVPPSARPVTVRNFDDPAYFFVEGIRGLALAREAERMVVVTPKRCVVFDPKASRRVSTIDGAADTAALTDDGAHVALARGESIELFTESGTPAGTIAVRGGARALSFSADGKWLACGGAGKTVFVFERESGKELVAIDAGGEVRALDWGGPKRVVALADQGAASRVVDVDVGKKKSTHAELPSRMTYLSAKKKLTLVAGGTEVVVLDGKLAKKFSFAAERPVLGAVLETEKTALVQTDGGVSRAHFAGKALKWSFGVRSAVSAFVATGDRLYAAADGTVFRYHDDPAGAAAEGVHYKHPTAIVPISGGSIATAAWDGRILLWPRSGGVAKTLATRSRLDDLSATEAGTHLYFADEHDLLRLDVATGAIDALVGGDDVEEDLKKLMPKVVSLAAWKDRVAWGDGSGTVHCVRVSDGTELWATKLTQAELEALTFDVEGNVYGAAERGELGRVNHDGTVAWSRVEHGIDVVDGRLLGNPHRDVAAIATSKTRVASLASDHTVRVFDAATGRRTLRIFRPVGIFDKLAFSPDGTKLAFTWGGYLEIVDADSGAPVAFVVGHDLPGARGASGWATMMTVAWLDDATLLVGAETGRHYEVGLR